MQPATIDLSSTTLLAPALVTGAIIMAFFACHYTTERKSRRDFLRWCQGNRPGPETDTTRNASLSENRAWTHPSGLYGVGTAARGLAGAADSVGSFAYQRGRGYLLTILLVGLALAARLLLDPLLGDRLPYMFFSAAVLFAAVYAGLWETLLALILGFMLAEWFIVEPRDSFMLSSSHGWLAAILYFVIGLGIVWFKRSGTAAEQQALASDIAYLDRLKELDHERILSAMLSHIVETSPDAVFSLTTEGRIMTWNAATERLLGYSAKEAAGQELAFVLPPDQRARAEQALDSVRRGAAAQQWQTVLHAKTGSPVEASLTASAARDAAGTVIGISLVARHHSLVP
jgi:PAS domain S-box-containing protein